ncbi:MAG: hypothetical protein ACFB6S_06645 [Geminicoccaceae bacterium]
MTARHFVELSPVEFAEVIEALRLRKTSQEPNSAAWRLCHALEATMVVQGLIELEDADLASRVFARDLSPA